jgi:Leucine-rich repeat (LRR) protein
MGPAEVTEFVHRWHGSVRELARENSSSETSYSVDELDNYETAMLRHLDAAPHLRSLATTPLMCALLCAVNLNRHQHLPQDRMELYEVAVTMLAHRRDDERGVRHTLNLPLKAKLAALSDLAWWMTRNGRVEATRAGAAGRATHVLEQIPDVSIEADAALEYLVERSGIIQAPAEDRIDFVHRSFQEYLAAREAVDEDDIGMLIDNAHRDQWRETVVMAAGHAGRKQCTQLLTGLLDRADSESRHKRTLRLLAAACRETARKVDPDVSARIDAALETVVPPRSGRETRSLASAGASVLSKLPTSLDGLSTAKAAACIRTAALINGVGGLHLLANYANDPRPRVQRALADAWHYFPAEEYAKGVLAEAPLDEGRIHVSQARHARWTPALRNLTELMVSVHGIEDLSFLDDAQHLTFLYCVPNRIVNLEPLRSHRELSHLIIGSVGVRSLEPLTDIALESLYLKLQGEPSSYRSIDRLVSLRSLSLANVGLADLTPISRLPSLSSLDLEGVGAVDLMSISSLTTLTDLALTECDTDPTSLVTALPVLDELRLAGGHPPDFAAMYELLSRLSRLDLAGQEFDPAHLARATNLKSLQLMKCPISDVTPLAGLTQLEDLDLDGTLVTDLSPLAGLPRLTKIDVRNCPSELDLTPLSDLPQKATVAVSRGVEHRGLDSIRDRGHTINLVV